MTKLEETLAEELIKPIIVSVFKPLIEQAMIELKEAHTNIKPLLSKAELRKWLGVGNATIDNWVSQGMPIVEIKGEAHPKYLPKQVLEFLEHQTY